MKILNISKKIHTFILYAHLILFYGISENKFLSQNNVRKLNIYKIKTKNNLLFRVIFAIQKSSQKEHISMFLKRSGEDGLRLNGLTIMESVLYFVILYIILSNKII